MGWVGAEYRAMALSTAAIVCVAASNGGTTSQDLKTGYLVGSTPRKQQISLLVGVVTSAILIGFTLLFFNQSYTTTNAESYTTPLPTAAITEKTETGPDGKSYHVAFQSDSGFPVPQGKYLVDDGGNVAFVIDPGISGRTPYRPEKAEGTVPPSAEKKGTLLGPDRASYDLVEVGKGETLAPGRYLAKDDHVVFALREVKKLVAPKANLFALIIDGILTRKLPWSLVLVGVMIALVMELCGVASLPFAVGVYLPVSTSVPIFIGGIVRYVVDKLRKGSGDEEFSPGTLLSSGYIAGGAIAGLPSALVVGLSMEDRFDFSGKLKAFSQWNGSGIVCFAVLTYLLYRTASTDSSPVSGSKV